MAQSIGFFQFDNLVRGRVGFVFINFGVDTHAVYPHIFKMHLENRLLQLPEGNLASATQEQVEAALANHPKESAVVILDQTGERAEALAKALEAAGYMNAFYVKGGWDQLMKERERSRHM